METAMLQPGARDDDELANLGLPGKFKLKINDKGQKLATNTPIK